MRALRPAVSYSKPHLAAPQPSLCVRTRRGEPTVRPPVTASVPITATHTRMQARAAASAVRHIHVFAFRDRDDPEAGGSEEHAYWVCRHLALAGLDVVLHTAAVDGSPNEIERDGFR